MRFTVLWSAEAEADLAAIWMASENRNDVTLAAQHVDNLLSTDAHQRGEARDSNKRITFAPPLAIDFQVNIAERKAVVRSVWTYRVGPRPK